MLVTLDKPAAVRMFDYISEYWNDYLVELKTTIGTLTDEQKAIEKQKHYDKAANTEICVVVSSEQNEVDKFKVRIRYCNHRRKINEKFEKEFKDDDNSFSISNCMCYVDYWV